MVSTGALASCRLWAIDVLITIQKGKPVAMLKSLDDDSHVQTRLCQYEAINSEKGAYTAKQFILGKFYGYSSVHDIKIYDIRCMKECERQIVREFGFILWKFEEG